MSKAHELQALYGRLPQIDCQKKCQDFCGPISMSREERRIIVKQGKGGPYARQDGFCKLLTEDGRCSVYAVRPLICRLWGLMERTVCPHGCQPERRLSDKEAYEFMQEALRIGGDDGKFWAGTVQETLRKVKEERNGQMTPEQRTEALEKVGEYLIEQSIQRRSS